MSASTLTQEETELGGQPRNKDFGSPKTFPDPETLRYLLRAPLPKEAIKQHPTKKFLSTVNVAYIIERLNDVFGEDGWQADYTIIESEKMIVVRCDFQAGNIKRTAYGGNENQDRGDSYKGACTDALSKAASQIGIAQDVYKGLHDAPAGQIQVSNGQATVTANKAVAGTPQQSAITKKTTVKPAVQKVDKQTDFPHGANAAPTSEPVKEQTAKFEASEDDIPDNIGSPKPTQADYNAYGITFRGFGVDMNKIGSYMRKKYNVEKPKDELNKTQWDETVTELKAAFEAKTLTELLQENK